MFADCKIFKKNNVTVVCPQTDVQKFHGFELDQVFYKFLISSKKKICVFRDFRDEFFFFLEEFCRPFDIVFLEQECWDPSAYIILDPNKFVFVLDHTTELYFNDPATDKNTIEFIPFNWLRTSINYSRVNRKLWSKPKHYYLTARMNNPRPWKVELMSKLWDNENLTWSALRAHSLIPGSPKIFESESKSSNTESPSKEQILSWSLLCLEVDHEQISEKTFQHLYHKSPTIWHASKSILDLEQFGFIIKYNGFDYSYLDMPDYQKIDRLYQQIRSMDKEDYKDFYHQNIKETENNHRIMKDPNYFYHFFTPKIQKYL